MSCLAGRHLLLHRAKDLIAESRRRIERSDSLIQNLSAVLVRDDPAHHRPSMSFDLSQRGSGAELRSLVSLSAVDYTREENDGN